jgi:GT2 family glycosyltransferase
VLEKYPWARVIRNETNLGFAAACNAGARAAAGRYVCHLNNDIIAQPRWLAEMLARMEPGVGIVGARLFFPNDTIQHAGVAMFPARFGIEGVGPFHLYWQWPRDTPVTAESTDLEIVTGACMLTPRDLFLELGGFDEIFWNGYEDVDYCLRVRERGLRVVYEPRAMLYHFESQSGIQRKRRMSHNIKTLGHRWGSRKDPDQNRFWLRTGMVRRETFINGWRTQHLVNAPPVSLIVHGAAPLDGPAFMRSLADSRLTSERRYWFAGGVAPGGFESLGDASPLDALRALLDERGDRSFAFVDTATRLEPSWLDVLANAIEYGSEVVASTVVPEGASPEIEPCAADARCSLVNLRELPLHVRFGAVDSIGGAVVDLTWQAVGMGLSIRAVRGERTALGTAQSDPRFAARFGSEPDELRRADPLRLESACADPLPRPAFASIVLLSWNAPDYTKAAVESIRAHTGAPYEIIIIDNGSGPATLAMLHALPDVRLILNRSNMGFAHGCNQGIAAASGTHIVLLNNDVIVTDGWLESLLDVHRRDPLVGVSAPRSNRIVGHQQISDVHYTTLESMHEFAAGRSKEYAGIHYRTNRAIGFCLCIAREVIDSVGGIDTRFGIGNFEDDDFCIRVRAAGYQIAVCEDAFIHHFGSVSFNANKVDYVAQMQDNWKIFAVRWGLPEIYPAHGYNAIAAILRGFVRARDYVPVASAQEPPVQPAAGDRRRSYATAFVAVVDGEAAWSRVGPVVSNYIKSLSVDDSALFAIGVTGDADAATIGARIARSIDKLHVDELRVADIDVVDVDSAQLDEWVAAIPAELRLRVAKDGRLNELDLAADRSPSGFVRTVRGVHA